MTREIPLTRGLVALVNDEDFDRLGTVQWYAQPRRASFGFYAFCRGPFLMHRLVLSAGPGEIVDHINGNTLDNRRENLRFADIRQNAMNRIKRSGCSSQYKGVSFDSRRKTWRAVIRIRGKFTNLGSFSSEELAARRYDAAARHNFGEFARPNFPEATQ
jgi:hypothetical protein